MTKLYCPKCKEEVIKLKAPYLLNNELLVDVFVCQCEEQTTLHFRNDCLTEEQLEEKLAEEDVILTNIYTKCYGCGKSNKEKHLWSGLCVECAIKEQSDLPVTNESQWINFSDRKPVIGQRIIGRLLGIESEGVYYDNYNEIIGYITTSEFLSISFVEWRPAQPEIQGSSEPNTQEFEKKDCVLSAGPDGPQPLRNFLPTELYCLTHKSWTCNPTVRKDRTFDQNSTTSKMEAVECEHSFFCFVIGSPGNAKKIDTTHCVHCGAPKEKPQSQIAIEKVIEAFELSADFHLKHFAQEDTPYAAAARMISGFSQLLVKKLRT